MVIRANPEKKEEKERIRLALLRATLRLAAAHGFASLGLREVSREALIAPTSFYRHFADMEELGLALIDESVAPLLASVTEQAKGNAKAAKTVSRATAEAMLEAALADVDLARFFLAERVGGIARFRAAIAAKVAAFADVLAKELAEERRAKQNEVSPSRCESAAEAIVAVLLDAAFRAIDLGAGDAHAQARVLARAADQAEMIAIGASIESAHTRHTP